MAYFTRDELVKMDADGLLSRQDRATTRDYFERIMRNAESDYRGGRIDLETMIERKGDARRRIEGILDEPTVEDVMEAREETERAAAENVVRETYRKTVLARVATDSARVAITRRIDAVFAIPVRYMLI